MLRSLLFTNSARYLQRVPGLEQNQPARNENNVKQSTEGEKEQTNNRCQISTKGEKLRASEGPQDKQDNRDKQAPAGPGHPSVPGPGPPPLPVTPLPPSTARWVRAPGGLGLLQLPRTQPVPEPCRCRDTGGHRGGIPALPARSGGAAGEAAMAARPALVPLRPVLRSRPVPAPFLRVARGLSRCGHGAVRAGLGALCPRAAARALAPARALRDPRPAGLQPLHPAAGGGVAAAEPLGRGLHRGGGRGHGGTVVRGRAAVPPLLPGTALTALP